MHPIYHISHANEWEAGRKQGFYSPDGFATDHFIHCSTHAQIERVANHLFVGHTNLRLLEIDPHKIPGKILYENLEGGNELFPHIYGPIPTPAVHRVTPLLPDINGTFTFEGLPLSTPLSYPLNLDSSLNPLNEFLLGEFISAESRLRAFAQRFGWEHHLREPFIRSAWIFNFHKDLIAKLAQILGPIPENSLPDTFSAALEKGHFIAIAPSLYREIYPEGDEPESYSKLITHELAHRLHVRILGGDEEQMGPIWFYEGFALFAADQFPHTILDRETMMSLIATPRRCSYAQYAAIFRWLVAQKPLENLIEMAGKPGFNEWVGQRKKEHILS